MIALPDYDSPTSLKTFLDSRDMAMQKKFGQNFLINRQSRTRLIDALELQTGNSVWEIGPGLGAMTAALIEKGVRLTAFEIDRGFCAALRDFFSGYDTFRLVEGDVLKKWPEFASESIPDRLFGNLPYNIAAAIIGDMISRGVRFNRVVVTVQKEVALRMAAKPDTEDYSSFSVLCQWAYDVSPLMDLSGGCFWPQPNVTSRAVVMNKKEEWPMCADPVQFQSILRGLFSSRRKTVRNNFNAWLTLSPIPEKKGLAGNRSAVEELARSILSNASIDQGCRAETLALGDFLRLSDTVSTL